MKLNKILTYALLLLPAFVLQSCLKDQEDLFEGSASERVEKYLSDAQKALQNSQYGWVLDNYPEKHQSYGGYIYTLQFHGDSVTSRTELDGNNAVTSLYSMKNVDGPVLSFDTYNTQLHAFATPSGDSNVGQEGDFELVIDSVGDDLIKVHGNRNQNVMYLRKLTEPAADYIKKVEKNVDDFGLSAAVGTLAGQDAQIFFDRDNRQATISDGKTQTQTAYCVTASGIRFYQPVTLGGNTVSELTYSDADLTMTGNNSKLAGIYDPAIITRAIGSIGADDNAFTRTISNLPHLDQFNIVPTADWLQTTVSGSSIQLTATANTTGELRSGEVKVVSKLSQQIASSFSVSQMNVDDILGDYDFYYTDHDNQSVKATARITRNGSALSMAVSTTILGTDFTLTFPAIFDQATGSIALQAGQPLYANQLTLTTGTGQKVDGYMVSAFEYGGGRLTYNSSVYALMAFAHNKSYGTYAQLSNLKLPAGFSGNYPIEGLLIYFATAQNPTSSNDMFGMIDEWKDCTLIKQTAGGAKTALKLAGALKAPASKSNLKRLEGIKIIK